MTTDPAFATPAMLRKAGLYRGQTDTGIEPDEDVLFG